MVRKIIWSKRAIQQRKDILAYWIERNQSVKYSKKLNALIKNEVKRLAKMPTIGKISDIENVRVRIVENYLIFYQDINNELHILSVWDGRRDPKHILIKPQYKQYQG